MVRLALAKANSNSTQYVELLKVLYYTSGLAGCGNTVIGISIANAFRRRKSATDFILLHNNSASSGLAERLQVADRAIPFESEEQLSRLAYTSSALYQAILSCNPDILIVNLHWFMLHHFLAGLTCKKVFLCRQVASPFFRVAAAGGEISFQPGDYDLLLSVEPWEPPFPMRAINPLIVRNREEILSRTDALRRLGLAPERHHCLFSFSGSTEDVAEIKKSFAYLTEEGYDLVHAAEHPAGLFPAVDYFNAFDYLICGAGYNSFWEAVYFRKEAYFLPRPRHFENQEWRVAECQERYFEQNGADQLVDLLLQL